MGDGKFRQQFLQRALALAPHGLGQFQHRADVLFDRKPSEDRRFLRQIPHADPGAPVHRQRRDVLPVQGDRAVIHGDQPHDHVKTCRLPRAVRAEQSDDFPLVRVSETPRTTGRLL